MSQKICVVGAGIIGTHCALQTSLRCPDASVTVIDREPFSYEGASSGNLGGFATPEVQPLSSIRNLLKLPAWAINPEAPIALRLRYISQFLPWSLRFVRSALTPGHFQLVVDSQTALMTRSVEAHMSIIGNTHLVNLISDQGAICLYRKETTMEHDWRTRWRLYRETGQACEIMAPDALHERMPDLNRKITCAVSVPGIRHWKDPAKLLKGLHDMARMQGVSISHGNATTVLFADNRPSAIVLEDGQQIAFDKLIVATGAWSNHLCRQLGEANPVNTERGYNTTISNTGVRVENLLLFPNDDFVATPMDMGLRLGGTVELAGLKAAPNFKRTDLLAQQIWAYFPDIDTSDRTEWMGHRPSLPDLLPVIGASAKHANVVYAFGHGHVGVTQSAITGRLVSQIVAQQAPEIDVAPFSIARFG